jgi:hypothetical protein
MNSQAVTETVNDCAHPAMIHDFILHFRAWAFSRPNADLDRTFDIIQAKLKSISEREDGLGQFRPSKLPSMSPTVLPDKTRQSLWNFVHVIQTELSKLS